MFDKKLLITLHLKDLSGPDIDENELSLSDCVLEFFFPFDAGL